MNRLKDPRQHDDLVNYRLKRVLRTAGAPAIRLCEGRFGIARAEWRVIAALAEDGPMSPTDLSVRCHLETARVARLLGQVVRKGFVRRTRLAGPRRRVELAVTEAGERLYADLFPQLAAINRRLMEVLTDAEATLLDDFLNRLHARALAIEAAGDGIDARTNRYLGGGRRDALRMSDSTPSRPDVGPLSTRSLQS